MVTMRKTHDVAFKAKVALEAVKGEKTIAQIASGHSVHPNQVRQWHQHLLEMLPEVFSNRRGRSRRGRGTRWKRNCTDRSGSSRSSWNDLKKIPCGEDEYYRSSEADVRGGEAPAALCLRAGCARGGRGERGIFLSFRNYGERESMIFRPVLPGPGARPGKGFRPGPVHRQGHRRKH